ncbi:MAG: 4-hydroxy-tetrahydrodipicolinate synthase [Owenweeksia sp.]
MNKFKGVGVALITPFDKDESIDFEGLKKLVDHCINGGVDYLVVMGTTAENPVLNRQEKQQVLDHVIKVNDGRKPVVYGIGGNDTKGLVQTIKDTDFKGIDAILSVSPYYNKPTQEGIYQHYKTLSTNSPVPIILYNVPGRTSSNVSAETTLRLAHDFENIIAVKEASGNLEQVMKIINERPEGFLVISGDDNLTLPMISCGGDGVISVSGQGFPEVFSAMVHDALVDKMDNARKEHYKLFEVTKMLFEEGNPGGIKAALEHLGVCGSTMRQPLWKISDDLRKRIVSEIEKHDLK